MTQTKVAAGVLVVFALALVFLNIYPLWLFQNLVFERKLAALRQEAGLITEGLTSGMTADHLAFVMDVLRPQITEADHITIADAAGLILYDTAVADNQKGQQLHHDDFAVALGGKDVFRCRYASALFASEIITPVLPHGEEPSAAGVVLLSQIDAQSGKMFQDVRQNILLTSVLLLLIGCGFSLVFSHAATRRFAAVRQMVERLGLGDHAARVVVSGKDEIAQIADTLNHLAAVLEQNETSRRRFVANASHELKTPLAGIRLMTDSILGTPDIQEAEIREFVADIGDQTDRLARMTESLMRLSRLEEPPDEVTTFDPQKVVEAAERTLRPLARAADVTVRLVCGGAPVVLHGAEDDLYHVVFNLLDNAIKYNRPGGAVTLESNAADGAWRLIVRDTGLGIPPEDLPHIFDRFYRVDKARTRAAGGVGLGLAIVRQTAKNLGGDITVESTPGVGSTFTVICSSGGKKT